MARSTLTVVIGCAALLLTATASFADNPTARLEQGDHHVSPERKQASDQAMQAGLNSLQAANAAVGNPGQAIGDLQSAISSFNSALPIYKGHRERAIHESDRAIKELESGRKRAEVRAAENISKAISEAQQALQTN